MYSRLCRDLEYLHGPVVMAIARRGPTGAAIEFRIGNGYTAACGRALLATKRMPTGRQATPRNSDSLDLYPETNI